MWIVDFCRRWLFLRRLALDRAGQVVLGNLSSAMDERLVPANLIHSWLDGAANDRAAVTPFDAAFGEIKRAPGTYQFKGPRVDCPSTASLVAFRQVSAVRAALHSQQPDKIPGAFAAPADDDDMATFLLEERDKARQRLDAAAPGVKVPVLEVFNRRYPAWYSQRSGSFDILLTLAELNSVDTDHLGDLLRVLRFLGLPLGSQQRWMMVVFKPNPAVDLHRPTVMEGVDGPFFKQKASASDVGNWGTTADVHDLIPGTPPLIIDGAVEAVGRPMTVADIVDCIVFPQLPRSISPDDNELRTAFASGLLAYISPGAQRWSDLIRRVAVGR